ncbi:ribonuclease Z [Candidatus Woesearchaeota archaeon]|jgi:ribonuclease Z|nr:ribonuclease Z [Candidatus Woesearchaeota archaeon]MBT6520240.1 ribonuclease Z [Candidatus Woesearchaeota archaeon]MBT7367251.1 ribonuclease Z [Candidatus Woesearchaeota archaeon]
MKLTFLGTSAMVPTKDRNVSGIFLECKGEGILLDCGEGTQRQMNITGIKRTRVTRILISHWHGDHVSGIIGLIQTIGSENNDAKIKIYGPVETKKRMEHMMQSCIFDQRMDVEVFELEPKEGEVMQFFENSDFIMECAKLDHSIPCIGYNFIVKDQLNVDPAKLKKQGVDDGPHLRDIKNGKNIVWKGEEINYEDVTYVKEGKKISYVADTCACEGALKLAIDADLLISECVYNSEHQDKAEGYKHMSAKDAALLASNSGARKLVLTHFSQRYKNTQEIEEEASTYFDNVICAEDFMKIKL